MCPRSIDDRQGERKAQDKPTVSQRLKSPLMMQSPPARTNTIKDIGLTEPYCAIAKKISNGFYKKILALSGDPGRA